MKQNSSPPIGHITQVEPGSLAAALGVRPGDGLLAVNDTICEDVIDVQYWASDEWVALTLLREGAEITVEGARAYGQALGLEFAHPTFDTDIRRCNNLCGFCFVLQMPPHMRRTLYIKDDDYRYSFLHGHYVTLTNLDAYDWERIAEQRLSPLYVSVHATALELRRRCLHNPNAPDVMEQLRWLRAHDIEVHTQIVVTPGLNDGPHLAQSVHDLAALWPTTQSISIVPVGLTKHHKQGQRIHSIAEMHTVLDACERWQDHYRKTLGTRLVYPTAEWYLRTGRPIPPLAAYEGLSLHENGLGMVRAFLDDWDNARGTLAAVKPQVRSMTLVTGTLFAPTLTRAAHRLAEATGVHLDVVPVVNRKLGDTITVAGLLMAEDVITALQEHEPGERVVLPRVMFDHPEALCLDDIPPAEVEAALGRPVYLADTMQDAMSAMSAV